jgi:ParB/RepB/Spo0J family partition protein
MSRRLRTYLESCQQIEPLEINLLVHSKSQVRSDLGDLEEVSASIREHGLLQPILVRPLGSRFEVICGNRRLEACRRLMKRRVDCIVRDLSDRAAFEISLVENVQRRTLSPIEEARAFRRYVTEFGWGGVSDLSVRIGKSEEYVSHRILLLDLPPKIIASLERNELGTSQAQELLWFKNASARDKVFDQLSTEKLSVAEIRQARKQLETGLPIVAARKLGGSHSSSAQLVLLKPSPDSHADFEFDELRSMIIQKPESRGFKDQKVIEEAILALRVALIRLDSAISKCESKGARSLLMAERLVLHGQIDRLIRGKTPDS